MLLITVVNEHGKEGLIEDIQHVIECFKSKGISIGMSESIQQNMHLVKIYCDDRDYSETVRNKFNIHMAEILYRMAIDEYCIKEMAGFLNDTYFFLKEEEIDKVAGLSERSLKGDSCIRDEDGVYCMNKKNEMMGKITRCIQENDELNVRGFLTFRMKELRNDIESIVDKVVEKYMVEREYDEFIKLLKYFVEIQDSKMEEVHIVIDKDGSYGLLDEFGMNIMDKFLSDLSDVANLGSSNIEDLIISGLITNCPKRIIIHCVENCINRELIETIKNVFTDRVSFCKERTLVKH